jgi:acylglycerol lipase
MPHREDRFQGRDGMAAVRLPLLILQGSGDRVVDPDGARRLHLHASAADKTLRLYDGLYHDLLHEPEKEQVLADLTAWLGARQ